MSPSPDREERVLRAHTGDVVARTALSLALLGALGALGSFSPFVLGALAVAVLAWAVVDLRARVRIAVDHRRGRLRLPEGLEVRLDDIADVSLSDDHPDAPDVRTLFVTTKTGQAIPAYVGPTAWAEEARGFVLRARARHRAEPSAPSPELSEHEKERAFVDLARSLERTRAASKERILARIHRRPPSAPVVVKDAYDGVLQRLSRGEPPGEPWRELGTNEAKARLAGSLAQELAYGHPLLPDDVAFGLAQRFVALFGPGARFFTLPPQARLSSTCFDEGIVVVDDRHVALVWIESDNPGR